ncbi:MAG: hypothetical protein GX810_10860 [Clostridiales bacterium]|nr:hypothetical protein [Clostridiales bacterium]
MKLTGRKIISNKYGEGVVTAQEAKRITVSFDGVGEKLFAFPRAFLLDLRMKDRRSQKTMDEFLTQSAAQEEAEQAKAKAQAAAKLIEAFENVKEKKQRKPRAKAAPKRTTTQKAG